MPRRLVVALSLIAASATWSSTSHAVDYYIKSFDITVSPTQVRYRTEVCNAGSASTTQFQLGLFINRSSMPACTNAPSQAVVLDGLAQGACTTHIFVYNVPAGAAPNLNAWVVADVNCLIGETNEKNNAATKGYSFGAPDLYIQSFNVTVTGPAQVRYDVTACNKGVGVPSSTIWSLDIYNHTATLPGCATTPNYRWKIAGLATNACVSQQMVRNNVPNGNFMGWARADGDCVVTEASAPAEQNNNLLTEYSTGNPNLTVKNLTVDVVGSSVTYTATVCNQGAAVPAAVPVRLELYYDREFAPDCSTTNSDFVILNGLASGTCTTRTFSRVNAPGAIYQAWARVDANCAIVETDETDNNAKALYTVPSFADFYIGNFNVQVAGNDVRYVVQVCNKGLSTAAAFEVALFYNQATAPTCTTTEDNVQQVTGLGAGACKTLTFNRTGVAAGSYTGYVMVDSDCQVSEETETNNTASEKYTTGAAPNLTTKNFTATVVGTTVNFSVQVCNEGGTTTFPFDLELYYGRTTAPDCASIQSETITFSSGIAAGTCQTFAFSRTNTPVGNYTAWARADADCGVIESNESDNNSSVTYAIAAPQPDYHVTAFTASTSGTKVTYDVEVCNQGATSTASFDIKLFYNQASAPVCANSASATVTVAGGLAANVCTTRQFVRTVAPAGSQTAQVLVDGACTVAESDETNNSASAPYTIVVPDGGVPLDQGVVPDIKVAPDLGVPDAQLPPDGPIRDGQIEADAALRDRGTTVSDRATTQDSGATAKDSGVADKASGADKGSTPPPPPSTGCCSVSAADGAPGTALLGLLLGLALLLHRRRLRRRRVEVIVDPRGGMR